MPAMPAPRTTTSGASSAAKVPPSVARERRLHNLGDGRLDVNSTGAMDELGGRVAVVTGAASGIGLALCERFVAEGMRVVMADVDPVRLEESAGELEADPESLI